MYHKRYKMYNQSKKLQGDFDWSVEIPIENESPDSWREFPLMFCRIVVLAKVLRRILWRIGIKHETSASSRLGVALQSRTRVIWHLDRVNHAGFNGPNIPGALALLRVHKVHLIGITAFPYHAVFLFHKYIDRRGEVTDFTVSDEVICVSLLKLFHGVHTVLGPVVPLVQDAIVFSPPKNFHNLIVHLPANKKAS